MEPQEGPALVSSTAPTPPLLHGAKRGHPNGHTGRPHEREGSEPIDARSLSKALQEFKETDQSREKTPSGSPSRKRQRIYGDRYDICRNKVKLALKRGLLRCV